MQQWKLWKFLFSRNDYVGQPDGRIRKKFSDKLFYVEGERVNFKQSFWKLSWSFQVFQEISEWKIFLAHFSFKTWDKFPLHNKRSITHLWSGMTPRLFSRLHCVMLEMDYIRAKSAVMSLRWSGGKTERPTEWKMVFLQLRRVMRWQMRLYAGNFVMQISSDWIVRILKALWLNWSSFFGYFFPVDLG